MIHNFTTSKGIYPFPCYYVTTKLVVVFFKKKGLLEIQYHISHLLRISHAFDKADDTQEQLFEQLRDVAKVTSVCHGSCHKF